ncbi:MAG: PAS domain-containing protein [bacterium]
MARQQPLFSMPVTILLADANKSYRGITRKMLKFYDANFIVDDCSSIQECLKKATSRAYDIIIINEKLEDGDCFALLSALKHEESSVQTLLLFEDGHEDAAMQARELGETDYLIKSRGYLSALPFTVKQILEKNTHSDIEEELENVGPQKPLRQCGYFILNHHGKFLSANPGMESICGYSEDELLELSLLDLLPKGKEWELFEWLKKIEKNGYEKPFTTEFHGKFGSQFPVNLRLTPVRDSSEQLKSYRGELEEAMEDEIAEAEPSDESQQSLSMIEQLWELAKNSREEPMPKLLGGLAQLSCRIFQFQRATIAVLDKSKQAYIKVAMIGYSLPLEAEKRRLEVPKDVIDRLFANKHRIKVLYYNQDNRTTDDFFSPIVPDRRSQSRRPIEQWHPRDVVLLNLADSELNCYGYISLDDPAESFSPNRDFFHCLEIFGRLASMVVENHVHFMDQDQRIRRLTQVLVTSNIFKLYLGMQDLLREIVWSVKFSLDFNLVALMLVGQKSGRAEIKAVACDDKIVSQQLLSLSLDIDDFVALIQSENKVGKSYFIKQHHDALQPIKRLYYNRPVPSRKADDWSVDTAIVVPLKSRHGRIMGAILVDDPADLAMPDPESLHILEILANQISVAIENRIMYVEAKRKQKIEQTYKHRINNNAANDYRNAAEYNRRSFWTRLFKEA